MFGGGPSLKNFDPERLAGRRRIAINRIVLPVDVAGRTVTDSAFDPADLRWPGIRDADVLYFGDRSWWQKDGPAVLAFFRGKYIVTSSRATAPNILNVMNTGMMGLETKTTGVRSGSNSGYQAINLAYHFGVRRIVLLGFDQNILAGESHVHGGYGMAPESVQHVLQARMLPFFAHLVKPLAKAGVEVLNASPESALTWWPKITLDEAARLT